MKIEKLKQQITGAMRIQLPNKFIAHIIIESPFNDIVIVFSCFAETGDPALFVSRKKFPAEIWPFQGKESFTTKTLIERCMTIINAAIEGSPIKIPKEHETKKFLSIFNVGSDNPSYLCPVE